MQESPQPTKRCSKCQEEKSSEDFPRDRTRPDGRYARCKVCLKSRPRTYDKSEAGRAAQRARDKSAKGRAIKRRSALNFLGTARALRNHYGLDRETALHWATLMKHDGSRCAICGLPTWLLKVYYEKGWPWFLGKRTKRLSLDHIVPGSNTGGLRLLCGACNRTRGDARLTDEEVLKVVSDKWNWITSPRFLFWLHTTPGEGGRLHRSEATAKREAEFTNGATEV